MNEWGFCGHIASWWDDEARKCTAWGFDQCELENQGGGDRKRSDLTVPKGGVPLVCGEVRLPDHEVPWPSHPDNLSDAIDKASRRGARWAFTSDGVTLLLLDVHKSGQPIARVVHKLELFPFDDRRDLDSKATLDRVERAWREALSVIAPIVLGERQAPGLSPDDLFVESVRALLWRPVAAIRDALTTRAEADSFFAEGLIRWMVDDQGWPHSDDTWGQELTRAAELTAYVFVVRLMFYEALRRAQPALQPIQLSTTDPTLAADFIAVYFRDARNKSQDYETLFDWDQVCTYAISSAEATEGWSRVLEHLHQVQLDQLGYDILGRLFERLIDPDERYHWGQHYTHPAVVDLMLSLAIPDGTGDILDPACGGGTFLVRGYVRKDVLQPGQAHQSLLEQIYGLDVSAFAASIATVNLASRDLRLVNNYPRVAARNFFDVDPNPAKPIMWLPQAGVRLGQVGTVDVCLDRVSSVVCNPPYVRLQELGAVRKSQAAAALARTSRRIAVPARTAGSANYHLYFWFHAAQFLEPGGRMVFITAREWLDSDYGAQLQKWLLDNFIVELVLTTVAETWFEEARVGTVVLSARLCVDETQRESNDVRFVTLRRSLEALYGGVQEPAAVRVQAVDKLRDRLLALAGQEGESDDYDWSIISQSDLRALGVDDAA